MIHDAAEWPAQDLEYLGSCPVCGARNRTHMYSGLKDEVCPGTPGSWNLWGCNGCNAAYLDPRPNVSAIGRAYARYYTHTVRPDNVDRRTSNRTGAVKNMWRGLRNDYLNQRFGHRLPSAVAGGYSLISRVPVFRSRAEYFIRHLNAPTRQNRKLLDVGSGGGEFLSVAHALGYDAEGLEPDQNASVTQKRGFIVHTCRMPNSNLPANSFDQITLSHVIEHFHSPKEVIKELFDVLRPGGRIWISTPNADAQGRRIFDCHWRGLEVPRHLVLFTYQALFNLLRECGYINIELHVPKPEASFYFERSLALADGLDGFTEEKSTRWGWDWKCKALVADRRAQSNPKIAESLTFVAYKPA